MPNIKFLRAAATALLIGAALAPLAGTKATFAQTAPIPLASVIPPGVEISFQATIKSIDPAKRELVLVSRTGDTETVKAGPGVRLELLKAGDVVNATYYRAVAFIVSLPGQKVPENEIAAAVARPVKAPGGVVLQETRVSGTVVGIDLANYTIQLINPSGGQVVTFAVVLPERRAKLHLLKVGDTLTAVVSEALAITVTPAAS